VGAPAIAAQWTQVAPVVAIRRGLARRCVRCGERDIFSGRFEMRTHCPQCNLHFERNPGAFIGGIGLNTVLTFVLIVVALVGSLVFIDGPWYAGMAPLVAVALIVPLAFFTRSKTIWVALEYIFVPPEPWD